MDAMREFYDDDVVMEEPAYGATNGLAANLKREQAFVDSVAAFKQFDTPKVTAGEHVSMYENVMAWTSTDGTEIRVEQVAVQQWQDGKIIHERFYYTA